MASRAWQSKKGMRSTKNGIWPRRGKEGREPGDRNVAPFIQSRGEKYSPLHPLHETIDHLLLAGLFERDRQLVAVDLHYVAVAEFLVKHAVVEREFRNGTGGFCDQFAFDHDRAALVARKAAAWEGIAARA